MEHRFEFTVEGGDPKVIEQLFNRIVDFAEENGLKVAGGYQIVDADPEEAEAGDD